MRYAGFWLRLVAGVIDCMGLWSIEVALVGGMWSLGWLDMTEQELGEGLGLLLALLFFFFPAWPYYVGFEWSRLQATPGKRLFNLRVTDLEGRPLGFLRANARHAAKFLSLVLYIGFLMVAFTSRKQGLHDLVARTLVLRRARSSLVVADATEAG